MIKITSDMAELQSMNITEDNISKLKSLFPEALNEGNIDFDVFWNPPRSFFAVLSPSLNFLASAQSNHFNRLSLSAIFRESSDYFLVMPFYLIIRLRARDLLIFIIPRKPP